MHKLVCQYGKVQDTFSTEQLVDLESACADELKEVAIDQLKDMTIIQACKLYVRGSLSGRTC